LSNDPQHYLELLQIRAYEKLGMSIYSIPTFNAIEKKLITEFSGLETIDPLSSDPVQPRSLGSTGSTENLKKLFTNMHIPKYQEPFSYFIMRTLCDEIETLLINNNLKRDHFPIIGTIPIGTLNARTIKIPTQRKHLLLFDSGVFSFIFRISGIISELVVTDSNSNTNFFADFHREHILKQLREKPIILKNLKELFVRYLTDDTITPEYAPQFKTISLNKSFQHILTQSTELFLLTHEYSHILLNHFENGENSSESSVREINYSWTQEYQADERGLSLILAMLKEKQIPVTTGYAGAELLLGFSEMLEKARNIISTGRKTQPIDLNESNTHPPIFLRRRKLMQETNKRSGKKDTVDITKSIMDTSDILWKQLEPFFYRKKDELNLSNKWLEDILN